MTLAIFLWISISLVRVASAVALYECVRF